MLARHAGRLPFARAVTHSVALEGVGDALETAQTGAAMKMLVAPNGAVVAIRLTRAARRVRRYAPLG